MNKVINLFNLSVTIKLYDSIQSDVKSFFEGFKCFIQSDLFNTVNIQVYGLTNQECLDIIYGSPFDYLTVLCDVQRDKNGQPLLFNEDKSPYVEKAPEEAED